MMDEAERLAACKEIALKMYAAGMGWNYDVIERLTRPGLPSLQVPWPTPFERGVLDRYQDRGKTNHRARVPSSLSDWKSAWRMWTWGAQRSS